MAKYIIQIMAKSSISFSIVTKEVISGILGWTKPNVFEGSYHGGRAHARHVDLVHDKGENEEQKACADYEWEHDPQTDVEAIGSFLFLRYHATKGCLSDLLLCRIPARHLLLEGGANHLALFGISSG